MTMVMALKVYGHRKAPYMDGVGLNMYVQGRDSASQSLGAFNTLGDFFD